VKVFSTLSGVKLTFWILSHFTILCTRQAKWYYTQNEQSLFICHSHFSSSPTYWISLQQSTQ